MSSCRGPKVILALILSSSSLFSQAPPRREPEAVSILTQAAAAMGALGLGHSQSGTGIQIAGLYRYSTKDGDVAYPFRAKVLGLDAVRWEVEKPEGTTITVVMGNSGWSTSPNGTFRLPVSQTIGRGLESFPFLAINKWVASARHEAKDAGPEVVAGRNLHRFSVGRIHNGDPSRREAIEKSGRCEVLVDHQTLIPARVRYFEHGGDWRLSVPAEIIFSDYRQVRGVLVPFVVERRIQNQVVETLEITSIDFQFPISTNEFQER